MGSYKKAGYLFITLGIILSYFIYVMVLKALPDPLSDYNGHTYVYLNLFKGGNPIEGWMAVPYCLWHVTVMGLNRFLGIPIDNSAAISTCIYSLFFYAVLFYFFDRWFDKKGTEVKSVLLAFFLSFIQGIYISWLDAGEGYLGVFSFNPLHNPTQTCVRGFGLVCFMLVSDIWERLKNPEFGGRFLKIGDKLTKHYVLLAVFLLLSASAKPTFAEMFIPAVAFSMLFRWIYKLIKKQSAGAYFAECLKMLLCAVPALVYILIQFLAYFVFGGSYGDGGTFIVTAPFEAWKIYSDNIVLSIFLALAFPLFVILIDAGFFLKDQTAKLALTGYLISLIEAGFFSEEEKIEHGDFLWPMMSGLMLVWTVATARYCELEDKADGTKLKAVTFAGWIIFAFHVLYGVLYLMGI